jgi:hypothetical protein
MPKIENWDNLPKSVREHLIDRMRDRAISIADLNQLTMPDQVTSWIVGKQELIRFLPVCPSS